MSNARKNNLSLRMGWDNANMIGRVDQRINRRAQIDMADSMSGAARNHSWMPGGQFGPSLGKKGG